MSPKSKAIAAIAGGLLGVGITVLAFYVTSLMSWSNRRVPVDPRNCRMDATAKYSCWDGQQKGHFHDCSVNYRHDIVVNGVLIPRGTVTCYKSLYWNVDTNMACIVFLLCFMFTILSRTLEHVLRIVLSEQRRLNWWMFLAGATQIHPICYSIIVLITYLNDRYFDMWTSQCYFSFTELFVFAVICFHLDSQNRSPLLSRLACATSLFHICELLMDEGLSIGINPRNRIFFAGDVASVSALLRELTKGESASPREDTKPSNGKLTSTSTWMARRAAPPREQDELPRLLGTTMGSISQKHWDLEEANVESSKLSDKKALFHRSPFTAHGLNTIFIAAAVILHISCFQMFAADAASDAALR